jgi:hypothetical protein
MNSHANPQAKKDSAAHKLVLQQPAAAEQELEAGLAKNALATSKANAKADPRTIMQMQRLMGNQATLRMVSPAPAPRVITPAPGTVQRAATSEPSTQPDQEQAPELARTLDAAPVMNGGGDAQSRPVSAAPATLIQRNGKAPSPPEVVEEVGEEQEEEGEEPQVPGVSPEPEDEAEEPPGDNVAADTGVDKAKALGDTGLTGAGLYSNIKAFFSTLANPEAAETTFSTIMQPFVSIFSVLGVFWAINKVRVAYNQMTGLGSAKDALAGKNNLSKDEKKLKASAEYGYAKVRRRFWGSVYRVVSVIVRTVMHFITLLSGGTAAMVSEGIAMAQSILDGLRVLFHKAKGFVKWLLGSRGKARTLNANQIVDSAIKGDKVALKLLVDLDPIGMVGRQSRALKYGYGSPPQPTNVADMTALLNTFQKNPEQFGTVAEFRHDTAVALKSQA